MEHRTKRGKIINFKSVAVGFLLCFCLILVSANSGNSRGRYDCCTSGTGRLFIIDTHTGHTWELTVSSTVDYGTPENRQSQTSYITPKG
jgi:hypothetical protein